MRTWRSITTADGRRRIAPALAATAVWLAAISASWIAPGCSKPIPQKPGSPAGSSTAQSPSTGAEEPATPAPTPKAAPPPPTPPKSLPETATVEPAATLPAFPWPPPRYSAFATIDRAWIAPVESATLASVGARLERAFDAAGYGERSYFWIPAGFALVSRLEQIRADATPVDPPGRWAVDAPVVHNGFIDYVRALFNAPPGFYRLIVFAVTDQDFSASPRAPSSSEAENWVSSGSLRLPDSVGGQPYSARHYTTALIYEFERQADQPAQIRTPSASPGQVHLEKAGLWRALSSR
jgi:hypothetical protein